MYGTLPKALKAECLVRTKEEDPEKLKERQATVQSMSVAELSQITSFSDIPVPQVFKSKKRAKSGGSR